MTLLSKGSRSPEERKGREPGSSCVEVAWALTSSLATVLLERRHPWQGWALLLWLPALLGRASDQVAICPLDLV